MQFPRATHPVAESFFATYKKELIHTRPWPTIEQLKTATFSWIETYYNRARRHSTLNYLTPLEYELAWIFRAVSNDGLMWLRCAAG